jgi:hypothetical protein
MSKLFVVTRNDLDLAYQGVQAGHGLAAWIYDNPDHPWRNHTLVYLAVDNEDKLKELRFKLERRGYDHSTFHEPDIGDELTAVACHTQDKIFSKLRKMGEN